MMFNPIEWWRKKAKERLQKQNEENEAFWKRHEEQKKLKLCECALLNANFVMKPCPINGGIHCNKHCIHFQKAYIVDFTGAWDSDIISIRIRKPSCRLWRCED